MLDEILGSKTAAKACLYMVHHGEAYATGIAKDLEMSLGQIQRQLDRFEVAGVLISKKVGATRVYSFNPQVPLARAFKDMISLAYSSMPIEEKEQLFSVRRRPRRKGKPVVSKSIK